VVVSIVSGSVWYNPKTFFPAWWKIVGRGAEKPGSGNMALVFGLTALASFAQAAFVAFMVNVLGPVLGGIDPLTGALTGLLLWAGVVVPAYLVNNLFSGHGLKAWAIEAGNHGVNYLLFGFLLGLWR
jgi:hypothetical protein